MHTSQPRCKRIFLVKSIALVFLCLYLLMPFGNPLADALHHISHAISDAKQDHHPNHVHAHYRNSGDNTIENLPGNFNADHQHGFINLLLSVIDDSDVPQDDQNQSTIKIKFDKHCSDAFEIYSVSLTSIEFIAFHFVDMQSQFKITLPAPPPDIFS